MEWHQAVETLRQHIVRIYTPQASGTGFLVARSAKGPLYGIATAAHVVNQAFYWEQPIRLQSAAATGETILVRPPDRVIINDEARDTAVILLDKPELSLPPAPVELMEEGYFLKVGNPIGWLGFPAIHGANLCFFSGSISAYDEGAHAYFVDGVAINGVSGGPAFTLFGDILTVVGVVSAYVPNRATGETLPGLGIVRDVSQFHELIARMRSLDEARAQETPPAEPPPTIGEPGEETTTSLRRPT